MDSGKDRERLQQSHCARGSIQGSQGSGAARVCWACCRKFRTLFLLNPKVDRAANIRFDLFRHFEEVLSLSLPLSLSLSFFLSLFHPHPPQIISQSWRDSTQSCSILDGFAPKFTVKQEIKAPSSRDVELNHVYLVS